MIVYSKSAKKMHKVIRFKLVRVNSLVYVVEKYTNIIKERRR